MDTKLKQLSARMADNNIQCLPAVHPGYPIDLYSFMTWLLGRGGETYPKKVVRKLVRETKSIDFHKEWERFFVCVDDVPSVVKWVVANEKSTYAQHTRMGRVRIVLNLFESQNKAGDEKHPPASHEPEPHDARVQQKRPASSPPLSGHPSPLKRARVARPTNDEKSSSSSPKPPSSPTQSTYEEKASSSSSSLPADVADYLETNTKRVTRVDINVLYEQFLSAIHDNLLWGKVVVFEREEDNKDETGVFVCCDASVLAPVTKMVNRIIASYPCVEVVKQQHKVEHRLKYHVINLLFKPLLF